MHRTEHRASTADEHELERDIGHAPFAVDAVDAVSVCVCLYTYMAMFITVLTARDCWTLSLF